MSLVELSLGRYPIPQPTEAELSVIFGPNALQDHMEAAKTGKRLCGGISCWSNFIYQWIKRVTYKAILNCLSCYSPLQSSSIILSRLK